MAKNRVWSFLIVVVAAFAISLATKAQPREAGDNPSVPVIPAIRVDQGDQGSAQRLPPNVGTCQYDNDSPFNRFGTLGGTVGNRFNPPQTHSVSTVSFALGGNFAASVVMTLWDVQAASVMVLARQLVGSSLNSIGSSPAPSARFMAPVATAVTGHVGSFIGGIRNTSYSLTCPNNTALASTCDGVALTAGNGDPHAVHVAFTSAAFVPTLNTFGSTGADIANVNAIFRVTGNNLPVELMSFEVD